MTSVDIISTILWVRLLDHSVAVCESHRPRLNIALSRLQQRRSWRVLLRPRREWFNEGGLGQRARPRTPQICFPFSDRLVIQETRRKCYA